MVVVAVAVAVVGRCCGRLPVLWEQGVVGWAFSRGGARLRSEFPSSKEARAREGGQVKPAALVGEPRFLTS